MDPITVVRKSGPGGRGRRTILNVTTFELLSDVSRIADGFSLGMPAPQTADEERPLVSGDQIEIRYKQVPILIGRVDFSQSRYDARTMVLEVVGRDRGGELVDRAAELLQIDEIGLVELAKLVVRDTSIRTIRAQGIEQVTGKVRVQTEPGESRSTFLRRYLQFLDALAWVDQSGRLVVGVARRTPPVGQIRVRKGDSNARVNVRRAPALAVTQATVLESPLSGAAPLEVATAASEDPRLLDFLRPVVLTGPDLTTFEDAKRIAKSALARGAQQILMVEAVISDFAHEGKVVPRSDQSWHVVIEPEGISQSMYLKAVRYTQGRGGRRHTRMLFVEHGTVVSNFVGDRSDEGAFV